MDRLLSSQNYKRFPKGHGQVPIQMDIPSSLRHNNFLSYQFDADAGVDTQFLPLY